MSRLVLDADRDGVQMGPRSVHVTAAAATSTRKDRMEAPTMTGGYGAAEVARARTELREAVDDLTLPTNHQVERDDGTVDYATTPGLLEQVEGELAQQSAAAGAFVPRSRPPLWVDAVQFLADIDTHTQGWDGATRAARIRAWSAHVSSHGTPGEVIDGRDLAEGWKHAAMHLLNPQPRMHLRGQRCPECKATKVLSHEDEGAEEVHALPALQIDPSRGVCRCQVCTTEWEAERWELLVQVLEQQKLERLQVDGYDPSCRARCDDERWDSHR